MNFGFDYKNYNKNNSYSSLTMLPLLFSYIVSWSMHEASTLIYGYGIHGDGIVVLLDPFEWSEEDT